MPCDNGFYGPLLNGGGHFCYGVVDGMSKKSKKRVPEWGATVSGMASRFVPEIWSRRILDRWLNEASESMVRLIDEQILGLQGKYAQETGGDGVAIVTRPDYMRAPGTAFIPEIWLAKITQKVLLMCSPGVDNGF